MLHDFHENKILDNLRNSDFEFHLTGSRFFKHHTDSADYDFMVYHEDIDLLRSFLTKLGFSPIKGEYGSKGKCASLSIYEAKLDNTTFQIQVFETIGDFNRNMFVRNFLANFSGLFYYFKDKTDRNVVWKLLFEMAKR